MKAHEKTHFKEIYGGDWRNRRGLNFKEKSYSRQRAEMQEKKLACPQCDQMFRYPCDLKRHLATTHTLERNFPCNVCGKGFKDQYSLKEHQKIHSENPKPYVCIECGKCFSQVWQLTQCNSVSFLDENILPRKEKKHPEIQIKEALSSIACWSQDIVDCKKINLNYNVLVTNPGDL